MPARALCRRRRLRPRLWHCYEKRTTGGLEASVKPCRFVSEPDRSLAYPVHFYAFLTLPQPQHRLKQQLRRTFSRAHAGFGSFEHSHHPWKPRVASRRKRTTIRGGSHSLRPPIEEARAGASCNQWPGGKFNCTTELGQGRKRRGRAFSTARPHPPRARAGPGAQVSASKHAGSAKKRSADGLLLCYNKSLRSLTQLSKLTIWKGLSFGIKLSQPRSNNDQSNKS